MDGLSEVLKRSVLKTGERSLQEEVFDRLQSMPYSANQNFSQIWSTMPLKVGFPKCQDLYVQQNFVYKKIQISLDYLVKIIKNDRHKVVLITAPPGMGKSRASEEIHTQLIVEMSSYAILYVKLSQQNTFWNVCGNEPTITNFIETCFDDKSRIKKYLQKLEEGLLIAVFDGYDEICRYHGNHVIALVKKLLDKKSKVVITSRYQEKKNIVQGLKLNDEDLIKFGIAPFDAEQKILMLQSRLNLDTSRY